MTSSKTKTKSTAHSTLTPNVPGYISGPNQQIAGQIGTMVGQTPQGTPANSLQNAAFTGAQALGGQNDPSTQATNSLMNFQPGQVTPQNLGDAVQGGGLNRFMNPWIDNVERYGLDAIERSRQMGVNQNSSDATRQGGGWSAFGDRAGVSDAGTNDAAMRNAGEFSGNIRSQGFRDAMGWLNGDINNDFAGQQFNAQSGLAGAGLRLNAANQGSGNQRANLGLMGDLGGQQHEIDVANNPQNLQGQWLTNLIQMLNGTLSNAGGPGNTQDQSGTSTTKSTPSLLDSIGGVVKMAGALGWSPLSDRRLKMDTELLGEDKNGNRWWRYRYLWDAPDVRHVGVMADEVPERARILRPDGYYQVDYSQLELG